MPTVQTNQVQWSSYEWPAGGDEWSSPWGDSSMLWFGTILPRIHSVAQGHILELAPGYGRCTQFLLPLAEQLTVVDLTEKCIAYCQQRFAGHAINYHKNDGRSLAFLGDDSIDFVFSWDSLVHAEEEVLQGYLQQLSHKMRRGGWGFIHHSNMGAIPNGKSQHWRDPTMSAQAFREHCAAAGMRCVSQEILEWETGLLSDTFSFFTNDTPGPCQVIENREFAKEVERLRHLHELYAKHVTKKQDIKLADSRRSSRCDPLAR